MPPKFFQIGFNKCGTTFIARLFDLNRIPAAHWLEGALADDIAYARLTGARPLARWADSVTAFTDMESVRFLNMPVIEGFREFVLLDRHYPGSIFLLNTRRVEDWIASRYLHRGGAYARSIAANLGVPLGDLGDIWARDWADHLSAVRAHFAGRPTFIDIDIDQAAPEDYRRALSPWYDLPHLPALPGAGVRQARRTNLPRVLAMIQTAVPGTDIDPDRRARLAARLARLAAPARLRQKGTVDRPPHAQALCLDMDQGRLRTADGADLPLHRGPDGRFFLAAQRPGLLRAAAVANDIAALTDRGRYWLDMRPATFAGSGPDDPADGPLIASLRRTGARNVFLWPAPWLHRIGNDGFPGAPAGDDPAWQDRADVAGWRGTLSGHHDRLTAEGAITALLTNAPGSDAFAQAVDALPRMSRWRFLTDHAGRDGVDLALIPDARVARALDRAGLRPPAPQASPRPPRHALCLSGSEGDADLLPLANSHAVVIRQDDGWESFAGRLFRPWVHVIPMAQDGSDLPDRLAWARANPDACRQMSRKARRLCHALADPAGRRLHLAQVLADYRRATGQD
ncbi:hypothetical protein [Paracoccus marcusii]|uniref:hypothetical protein n=1 Tax=Paracoccus marcusii TaxID=59779 RepID=UPI003263654D